MLQNKHVFLGAGHLEAERRMWPVIWLCLVVMVVEITGGLIFGSIALTADGLHMSTHAGALLLAALAYGYARKHQHDERFSFSTGKMGDLAGFTSAVVLAMIALLVAVDAIDRLIHPVAISFVETLPIACVGLLVNLASVFMLGHGHDHGHDHGHQHGPDAHAHDHPHEHAHDHTHDQRRGGRDNNMRAAVAHVIADAAVSVMVILALTLAWLFRWSWLDPAAALVGAGVIASWAWTLIRDTAAVLLDMNPDPALTDNLRQVIETEGDRITDLHLWRLGPGHFGALFCVATRSGRHADHYRARLVGFSSLSHVTIEIDHLQAAV